MEEHGATALKANDYDAHSPELVGAGFINKRPDDPNVLVAYPPAHGRAKPGVDIRVHGAKP